MSDPSQMSDDELLNAIGGQTTATVTAPTNDPSKMSDDELLSAIGGNQSDSNDNTQTIPAASGVAGTTIGAVGSGLMKGSEDILQTAQGGANIIGNIIGDPSSQDFGNAAQQIEQDRQKYFGNQESIHGKVLENLGQLPALVAMLGDTGGSGLLTKSASLERFAGQSALQAQPQTQGKPLKEQIENMAWAATKGALTGAVLGKAIKMGGMSGATLAASYSAILSGASGGDPNDILAGAISGAGLVGLSNPKALAISLSSMGSKTSKGASNLYEQLKTKGPITAAADMVGSKANNVYSEIHGMMDSQDRIDDIDHKIAQTKSESQVVQDNLVQNAQLLKAQADQEKLDTDSKTKDTLNELEKQKSIVESNVSSILAQKSMEIGNNIDGASKELAGNIDNTVDGIKGGKLRTFFNNISTAFTIAVDSMSDLFSKTSSKPMTRFDGIDAATSALEQISDANGNIDSVSPTAQALNRAIDFLKSTPLKGSEEIAQQVKNMRAARVPESAIQQYLSKNSKIDLSEPIPMKTMKGLFDRAKQADPYGSHEGDIARKAFGSLIAKKLEENGQDTAQFQKIMADMSDAISYKTRLSRIFQLKDGTAYNESGFKFLKEIATGKDETGKIINPSQNRLLDVLQNGLSIGDIKAEGTGDVSSSLIKMGKNLDNLQKQYKNIGYKEKATIVNIGKNFVARMAQAKAQGKLTKDMIDLQHKRVMEGLTQVKNHLETNVNEQLREYVGDKVKQQELLQRKKDIASTIGVMGLTVSVYASKIGYAFRAFSKLAGRNASGLGPKP